SGPLGAGPPSARRRRTAARSGRSSMAEKSTGRLLALLGLAGAAVYLAVWPHELGHAAAAWLLGCKADGWRTGTRWFLWGSQGGAIDFGCLARRGKGALAITALAGIAVNLVQLGVAPLLGVWWRPAAGRKRTWWLAATLL